MDPLISNRELVKKDLKPETQSFNRSTPNISSKPTDLFDDKNKNRQRKEGHNLTQGRKENHHTARKRNTEITNDRYWDNEGNYAEDNEESGFKNVHPDDISSHIDLRDTPLNGTEERNNNINVRRDVARRTPQSPLSNEDVIAEKKISSQLDENVAQETNMINTDSPPTPLPSPNTNQTATVVDAVAGTSASVAVNSFLKFSIQNILQVRKFPCVNR